MDRNFKLNMLKTLFLILFLLALIKGALVLAKKLPDWISSPYSSSNICVYNLTDSKLEYVHDEDERVAPASLTKMMTVLVSLENIRDLSTPAPIDVESYQRMVVSNSSMAGFYGNEPTTYRDLLYGTMLASGGECASSLAINLCGDEESFVQLMNEKAEALSLENTAFKNPTGLDEDGHYSSARDMARLLSYGLSNPDFRAIFTSPSYISSPSLDHPEGLYIESTVMSKLSSYEQNGFNILGGKSGTSGKAGNCWATLVEKDGKEYICVVMGSRDGDLFEGESHILDTLQIMESL